jgi:hypothetical protein
MVNDYTTWRKSYDEFDEERNSMGVTADAVYRSIDDGNDVTVWTTSTLTKRRNPLPPRSG